MFTIGKCGAKFKILKCSKWTRPWPESFSPAIYFRGCAEWARAGGGGTDCHFRFCFPLDFLLSRRLEDRFKLCVFLKRRWRWFSKMKMSKHPPPASACSSSSYIVIGLAKQVLMVRNPLHLLTGLWKTGWWWCHASCNSCTKLPNSNLFSL
jgi:hypothetical protein